MKKKLLLGVTAVVVAAGLAAGGWSWQRAGAQRDAVAAARPPTPDLSALPEALRIRVAEAEARAGRRFGAVQGLGELARLYHANGFLDEAARCYDALETLEPNEPRWPHLHATILAGFGEIEPALELWRRTLRLAPDYVPAQLRIADCELKSDRVTEAAAAYAAALRLAPDNAYAQLGLARIDFEAGRLEAARERLEKIVAQTNFELGYDLIVSLYERTGQLDRARAIRGAQKASGAYRDPPDPWFDGLLDECYDPYRLALAAGVMVRTIGSAKAVELLERAIELAPNDVSARFQLGVVSADAGQMDEARRQFERCTVLSPGFSDGWARLSALQAQLGEAAAADRTLATGLQHCPESPALHLMKARNLEKAGRPEEAIPEFKASIRYRPNEPDAYIELGNLLMGLGRVDEGVEQIRGALVAEPGNPLALSVLAFHAILTGDEAQARDWMTRVSQQPRVRREQFEKLTAAYRQQFGREWVSPAP